MRTIHFLLAAGLAWGAFTAQADERANLRDAIVDLQTDFGPRYAQGEAFLARLEKLGPGDAAGLEALRREALLANPLLDFDRLLVVRRSQANLGLPQNWQGNSCLPRGGFDNRLDVISIHRPQEVPQTLFQPQGGRFVGDVDLDFDAGHLLFSSVGANNRWNVFEMPAAGGAPVPLPLIPDPDIDNFDPCYLPDGNIAFTSTACFQGVPCVRGSSQVANLYLFRRDNGGIRRLTFDQDHSWCPTAMEDGRLLYLRWEYSDIPHFVSRILFQMNPDGTNQREFYGSNSYWPNSMFYARPIPGQPTQFVAVVGGHHGVPRMGELVLFDAARGRIEADGAIQRIPGRGKKVEPVLRDQLVDGSWPRFLHPWPLDAKHFLVSCQPAPQKPWGLYLADTFDNLVPIREEPGFALLEPVPLQARKRPPVIPSRVREGAKTATMQIADIYQGPGLKGVPRGTVKSLRLFTYHFAYHGMGGQIDRVGLDGPWDVKRVLGTVPVESDGSAYFEVPANTPISIQPLDADGRALQLMRSWTTAMPGEAQSCVGCHEPQNTALAGGVATLASGRAPSSLAPFFGPVRGFSFEREVQPVLDRLCLRCHDGKPAADGKPRPDFSRRPPIPLPARSRGYMETLFPPSYIELRGYVRAPNMESDMHLLSPYEFHASTTELVRILEAGHHGVKLEREDWDRLTTWIDLNTPAHGTWTDICGAARVNSQAQRRRDTQVRYDGVDETPEAVVATTSPGGTVNVPPEAPPPAPVVTPVEVRLAGPPPVAPPARLRLDLGGGVEVELVRIAATGSIQGGGAPTREVAAPYWMARTETSNRQFACFDPRHDSRLEGGDFLQFGENERGFPVNGPDQPVCRVSWNEARKFCDWLAARSGKRVVLPTRAQWEWACRAGASSRFSFGDDESVFPRFANLADASFRSVGTFGWSLPSGAVPPWRPAAPQDDKQRVSAPVGSREANAWGLHDMHGNVAEWVRDTHSDGVRRLACGGSWSDRPSQATALAAVAYVPWQPVYNLGFRIVVEEAP